MRLYSTNDKNNVVNLREAVIQGLAKDNGLFVPFEIPTLESSFFKEMREMSFQDISFKVAETLFDGEIPAGDLREIVKTAINFDAPIVSLTDKIFSLELFHGPTSAFKDFGARFMAGLLSYFTKESGQKITILVATSGDTGGAVASSFLGNPNINVIILYPSAKVSYIQEKQLTTLEQNITALEVKGTFDDCQKLVKTAFLDRELSNRFNLSSANSINIARLVPQSFYYFYSYSRLPSQNLDGEVVYSVPSGNFGNLTAGIFAKKMGLPVSKFIAATNINDAVPTYLNSGQFTARPSKETISNAMDVGNPSNFARMSEIFENKLENFKAHIEGFSYSDEQTRKAIQELYKQFQYIPDPHGAIAYLGLKEYLRNKHDNKVTGIFLETAHPAKFLDVVEEEISDKVVLPPSLKACLSKEKKSTVIENDYEKFKAFLLASELL